MKAALVGLPARLYRLSYGSDPLRLPPWESLRQQARGRWDDTEEEYRVLYCADTELGAFVETLQGLRQNPEARSALGEIDGEEEPAIAVEAMLRDRLRNRWIATLIPGHPDEQVADVHHGHTRNMLDVQLAPLLATLGIGSLKVGDVIASDRRVSRAASRCLYEANQNGLLARSAEHAPSQTIAFFETHSVSGKVRVNLVPENVLLALERGEVVKKAAEYLGLIESEGASVIENPE